MNAQSMIAYLAVVLCSFSALPLIAQSVPDSTRILKDLYQDIDVNGRFQWTESYSAVRNSCEWNDCVMPYTDVGRSLQASVVLVGRAEDQFYALTAAVGVANDSDYEFQCHYCPVVMGAITYRRSTEGWKVAASNAVITYAGAWGAPPESMQFVKAGAVWGFALQEGYGGQNVTEGITTLLLPVGNGFAEVWRAESGSEYRSSKAGKQIFEYSITDVSWQFEKSGGPINDIALVRTKEYGIRPYRHVIVERERYVWSQNRYVLATKTRRTNALRR